MSTMSLTAEIASVRSTNHAAALREYIAELAKMQPNPARILKLAEQLGRTVDADVAAIEHFREATAALRAVDSDLPGRQDALAKARAAVSAAELKKRELEQALKKIIAEISGELARKRDAACAAIDRAKQEHAFQVDRCATVAARLGVDLDELAAILK